MKKILLLVLILSFVTGCASSVKTNPFKAYAGMSAQQIYYSAENKLSKGKYSSAAKDFEALDALYPFGPYAQQGQLDIIYAYYKSDEVTSGLAAADRYIRLYPRDKHIDYVYYMKGVMSFEEGFTWLQRKLNVDAAPHDLSAKREAFTSFNQVVTRFPHSIYAPDSAVRMAYIRNLMARKELLLADFYLERKAYIAAANRAAEVVQHYSGSPSVPHALEIMVKAYLGAGLTDLAEKSYRILQTSYPNNAELKKLSRKFPQKG